MKPQHKKPTTFDNYAGNYAELIKDPIRERFAESSRFFQQLGIRPSALDWLDVGCGQGDMLRVGKPLFKSATGCDPSKGMLESCADLRVLVQESLDKLPFDDATFDFLTAVCVYHHVPYDERPRLTREALRVLKPGGMFCVIEHNPWNIATRVIVSRTPVDADANLLSPRKTRRMLSEAGSKVRITRYFLLFPESIYSYVSAIEDTLSPVPLGGQYS